MSQNKCFYIYLLLFSYSKLNPQCFLSQTATYDFITETRSCGLLYPALHVKYPLVISHAALTSQSPVV